MPKFTVTMTRTFVGVDRCSFEIEAKDAAEAEELAHEEDLNDVDWYNVDDETQQTDVEKVEEV